MPAQTAVRQLGTNALPELIQMLRIRDGALKRRLMGSAIEFRMLGCRITGAYAHQVRAAAACRVLGPIAEAAIPALIKLIDRPVIARSAGEALVAIGPKALSVLIQRLERGLPNDRAAAIAALSMFGRDGAPAIGALAKAVEDPDPKVRANAVLAFDQVREVGNATIISALMKAMEDKNADIRRYAVATAAGHGAAANVAIPVMRKCLEDADPEVRKVAAMAIRAVDVKPVAHKKTDRQ